MILKDKLTPNQCLLLFAIRSKISIANLIDQDKEVKPLLYEGYLKIDEGTVLITEEGSKLIVKYNNYFVKAKKKTSSQLMGNNFLDNIKKYRLFFPGGKLPSGKPARVNIKTLENGFRWFFENYDFTWDQVLKATAQYVNEYEDKDYMYMKTSQYFLSKEDRNKIKTSELADYCDMINEGFKPVEDPFKEKVV